MKDILPVVIAIITIASFAVSLLSKGKNSKSPNGENFPFPFPSDSDQESSSSPAPSNRREMWDIIESEEQHISMSEIIAKSDTQPKVKQREEMVKYRGVIEDSEITDIAITSRKNSLDFNLREGVIYYELMKPKYQED